MDKYSDWELTKSAAGGAVPPGFRPLELGEPRTVGDMRYSRLLNCWTECLEKHSSECLDLDNWFSATRRAAPVQRELHEDEGG